MGGLIVLLLAAILGAILGGLWGAVLGVCLVIAGWVMLTIREERVYQEKIRSTGEDPYLKYSKRR